MPAPAPNALTRPQAVHRRSRARRSPCIHRPPCGALGAARRPMNAGQNATQHHTRCRGVSWPEKPNSRLRRNLGQGVWRTPNQRREPGRSGTHHATTFATGLRTVAMRDQRGELSLSDSAMRGRSSSWLMEMRMEHANERRVIETLKSELPVQGRRLVRLIPLLRARRGVNHVVAGRT